VRGLLPPVDISTKDLASQSPDSVVVFDNNGKFVRSWGGMFRGGAHGMQYAKEGKDEFLYFCDEKHGLVTKRTLKVNGLGLLRRPGIPSPQGPEVLAKASLCYSTRIR
jgi:hypothetical protein